VIPLPSPHAAATLLLTVVAFTLFATARLRIELVCLLLIAVLALGFYLFPLGAPDQATAFQIAFGGFGHEALVAICALMILGRGLMVTGALDPFARGLARLWRLNRPLGLLSTLLMGMGISMFVNDTPVLVLMLPILMTLAARAGVAPSQTLMPVNCAILIGGMATTIGTSTNLIVVSIAEDLGLAPVGMFSFTPLVLVAAAIALPYLWLVMPRLLPRDRGSEPAQARRYRAILHAQRPEQPIARDLAEVLRQLGHGAQVVGVLRNRREVPATAGELPLQPGDEVMVDGTVDQLREASEVLRAPLAPPEILDRLRSDTGGRGGIEHLAEVVVGAESTLVGSSVAQADLAGRCGVAVIGLARAEPSPLRSRAVLPASALLEVGDVLLVRGEDARIAELERSEGVHRLEGGIELPQGSHAPIALAIVAAVILLAALRIMPIAIAALAGTIAMLASGTLRYDRIGRALSLEVIVMVAASIALGRALVETGAADWLGKLFSLGLASAPPAVAVGALMAFATLLTNFVSNASAAAVCTPIAMSLAANLGAPAEPFVLAVLFGCNLCYATPMAYQTNLIIMTAARYEFRDFVRAGLPLALLMIVVLALLLVKRYGM
jgi:di/tricarboxylate transporter